MISYTNNRSKYLISYSGKCNSDVSIGQFTVIKIRYDVNIKFNMKTTALTILALTTTGVQASNSTDYSAIACKDKSKCELCRCRPFFCLRGVFFSALTNSLYLFHTHTLSLSPSPSLSPSASLSLSLSVCVCFRPSKLGGWWWYLYVRYMGAEGFLQPTHAVELQ